ncbi:uncharacterized transmembrane protein DDB_G0285607-like isoform X1 [Dreissena polymorpha]|nr:uncharacterized transmembrane protein DDB_G0285607-like isoform X1 [Dreissena polymorpha]
MTTDLLISMVCHTFFDSLMADLQSISNSFSSDFSNSSNFSNSIYHCSSENNNSSSNQPSSSNNHPSNNNRSKNKSSNNNQILNQIVKTCLSTGHNYGPAAIRHHWHNRCQ